MKQQDTEQKLLEALERILKSNTINIKSDRKLSASAVEDEAGVSRSLSRHYPETFQKIKESILLEKSRKSKEFSNTSIVDKDKVYPLKNEVKSLKEENKKWQEKCDNLLVANIGLAEKIKQLEETLKNNKISYIQ